VREVVLHKSFIGLPPLGATRSAPESGELVIQYWIDPDGLKGGFAGGQGWVYADGRLITLGNGNGFHEQRLTPEGVELLRSEIVSTGLFDHHQPARREASPHSVIQVRIGERLVRVQVGCPGCPPNFPERLNERLAHAASWLPASAWKDRQIRAYVASRYAISYFAQPQTLERSRLLSLLPAAAEDLLRDKDTVPEQWYTDSADHTPIPITRYVSDLTTEEARALAQTAKEGERAVLRVRALRQEPRSTLSRERARRKRGLHLLRAHPPGRRARLLGVRVSASGLIDSTLTTLPGWNPLPEPIPRLRQRTPRGYV
jgi:hypothetical protein